MNSIVITVLDLTEHLQHPSYENLLDPGSGYNRGVKMAILNIKERFYFSTVWQRTYIHIPLSI